jgi:hypothetical protein
MRTIFILMMLGCDSTPSTANDLSMAAMPDLAMPSGMTDKQICDTVCTTMISCGIEYGSGCSGGCQASDVFLPCAKMVSSTDCNALSLCAFKQYAKDICGNVGGVPAGTNSCNDTANCEGTCNATQPGVASCVCSCIAGLLPVKASALLINNQCALAKCPTECGPTSSGAACNTCAANMCVSEHGQCASQ